jgi:hypothetical protein
MTGNSEQIRQFQEGEGWMGEGGNSEKKRSSYLHWLAIGCEELLET